MSSQNPTFLSDEFDLPKHGKELEFLDLDLSSDLPVYVDPILLYRSPLTQMNEAHTLIVEFVSRALKFTKEGKSSKAKRMFEFPDAENLLGIAEDGSGRGPRKKLAHKIYNELVCNQDIQKHGLGFLNELQLLIEGISFDLISDAAVQISKDVFINYTQIMCRAYKIKTTPSPTRYFDWDENDWDQKLVELPTNPLKQDEPFLLTPRTVVRRYPTGDYVQFYNELYRDLLYEKKRESLFHAFGKEPKIAYKDIEEKYRTKKEVVAYLKEVPAARREFYKIIRPHEETAWLEAFSAGEGTSINQSISPETLEILQSSFKGTKWASAINGLVEPIEHQFGLKRPRKKLAGAIVQLVELCKESLVLVLGKYDNPDSEKRLAEIKDFLGTKYEVVLIRDVARHEGDRLIDQVLKFGILARFVVIEDTFSGGQLFEMPSILSNGFITAILREKGKGSSYMSKGVGLTFANAAEIDYQLLKGNGIDPEDLRRAVSWAEEQYKKKIDQLIKMYPWKK